MQITNGFMNWYHGNNEKEQEPPKGGIRRVGYILCNYFGKLVLINMLFILFSIPVVTLPAALVALNRYLIKIVRVGYGFSISDFLKEFRANIFKSIPVGIFTGGLGLYAYYLLSLAGNYERNLEGSLISCIGFGVLIIFILLSSYSYVLLAMLDLPNISIIKNALILLLIEWKSSVLLVFIDLCIYILAFSFAPYSIIVMVLIGFSLQQLFLCAIINQVVERRILVPYENIIDDTGKE